MNHFSRLLSPSGNAMLQDRIPNILELMRTQFSFAKVEGWTSRDDGTTDDEIFLRGVQMTNDEGLAEFLTVFPGHYTTRATHIHMTAQVIQHIGQVFFEKSLIEEVYDLSPYASHKATLNRTLSSEDSDYSVTDAEGYSAIVDGPMLGEDDL